MRKNVSVLGVILVCVAISGFLVGCTGEKEKTFSKAGMSIVLTDKFVEKDIASQTAYFESTEALVTALKEDFPGFESADVDAASMDLAEYANLVLENNRLSSTVETKDGLTCFEYEKTVSGKNFTYFATVFKGEDAFWLIQFACETQNYKGYSDKFVKWAKGVKV